MTVNYQYSEIWMWMLLPELFASVILLIVLPDKSQHMAVYKYSLSEQMVLDENYRLMKHILCTLNFFISHGFWDDYTKERLCVHIFSSNSSLPNMHREVNKHLIISTQNFFHLKL